MAKWGSADFGELKDLQKRLFEMEKQNDEFCRTAARVLAARLIGLALKKTPRGTYPVASGKNGGTLKRGWISETYDEAANGSGTPTAQAAKKYAMSLPVTKAGSTYTIEIINPVEYASYVEFGHRTVNGGVVEGQYFFTKAQGELEIERESIIRNELDKFLKQYFS